MENNVLLSNKIDEDDVDIVEFNSLLLHIGYRDFKQTICIALETKCADLFLYSYNSAVLHKLLEKYCPRTIKKIHKLCTSTSAPDCFFLRKILTIVDTIISFG